MSEVPLQPSKVKRFQGEAYKAGGFVQMIGGVPREHKMLKGHLPRVMYHQVY